jgi:hypothetical protein
MTALSGQTARPATAPYPHRHIRFGRSVRISSREPRGFFDNRTRGFSHCMILPNLCFSKSNDRKCCGRQVVKDAFLAGL